MEKTEYSVASATSAETDDGYIKIVFSISRQCGTWAMARWGCLVWSVFVSNDDQQPPEDSPFLNVTSILPDSIPCVTMFHRLKKFPRPLSSRISGHASSPGTSQLFLLSAHPLTVPRTVADDLVILLRNEMAERSNLASCRSIWSFIPKNVPHILWPHREFSITLLWRGDHILATFPQFFFTFSPLTFFLEICFLPSLFHWAQNSKRFLTS